MMELDSRNVSLKPAHRKQIMAWLKRSLHLGQQVGDFVLKMTIERTGRTYQVQAQVKDQAGSFTCKSRERSLLDACREVAHQLRLELHNQLLQRTAA